MDKNQKIAALESLETGIIEELGRTKAEDTTQFSRLLDNLGRLDYFLNRLIGTAPDLIISTTEPAPEPAPVTVEEPDRKEIVEEAIKSVHRAARKAKEKPAEPEAPAPVEEPAPVVEEVPAPVEEPKPEVTPAPKPEPRLTKQDMITQLTFWSNERAVDVAAIMLGKGWAKLSEVPESKYAELLDAVKEAAG